MPVWMQANRFILTGYRPITPSMRTCILSILHIHNEFANIWSHGLGALFFTGLIIQTWTVANLARSHTASSSVSWIDHALLTLSHFGFIFCLASSAQFHVLQCHSKRVCENCIKIDCAGIVVALLCHFTGVIFYAFYCHPIVQFVSLGLWVCLGFVSVSAVCISEFATHEYRMLRTLILVGFGVSPSLPVAYSLIAHGLGFTRKSMGLDSIGWTLLTSCVGVPTFYFHVPERFYPRRFDIWGNSHLIWHVLIMFGMWFLREGLLEAFYFWHDHNGDCTIPMDRMMLDNNAYT
ncbi:hemolysin-III related-domain-containing protein [Chytriomyces sp. MP71]|nr:hemolysin-III related-domain-containing protein [Chytriomyces sp. MP71]